MAKRQALDGIKVADFSWVIAAPLATECLADHGATVVRIESQTRPEILRTYFIYAGDVPGINRCGAFAAFNSNKYGVTLNLNHPKGIEVAKKLVAWSDVVVENFTPGRMERWGLGYEELKTLKPDIIMLSLSMQGQTGPYASQPGFGATMQGKAGVTHFIGWPDRKPVGTPVPWTDFIAPSYAVIAVLGAVDYRRRTGKGQCIDLSQLEAGVSFFSQAILDYTANKRVQNRMGNRGSYAAPHGVYRCKGDDRWCAIAVFSDEEWDGFCGVLGNPQWTMESRFAILLGRKQNEDELDCLIENWTTNHPAEEVTVKMQAAGVPAGLVANGKDLDEDPQLKHRSCFVWLEHAEMGMTAYDVPPFRLSKTPAELRMPAPCLGQHNEYVYTKLLGIPDEEFVELLQDGVFD